METIRIFVSSPGDVAAEREKAREIIERFCGEFRGQVQLDPFMWEDEPQDLSTDFQGNIPPIEKFDVVICILWSRLGTRLGSWHSRPGGGAWDSGTEMEIMTALEARKKNNGASPSIHVFLNVSTPHADLDDSVLQKFEQRAKLKALLERLVKDQTEDVWKGGHTPYRTLDEFEKVFESHLRSIINRRIRGKDADWVKARPVEWRSSPFRGLRSFEFEHAPVFFGRTRAIEGVTGILRQQDARGRPFALILGMSGGGKSSLARAGVTPLLVKPGIIEKVGVWRRAAFRPAESGAGPIESLAAALLRPEALPEMGHGGQTPPKFAEMLRTHFSMAMDLMNWALHLAAERKKEDLLKRAAELRQGYVQQGRAEDILQLDAQISRLELPQARLVLVVDQMEELFTQDGSATERDAFVDVLHALVTKMRVFVVATLRSDFYHRYQEIPQLVELVGETGRFDLVRPTPEDLAQMVRLPAQAAGLRFAQRFHSADGASDEESLDAVVCGAAAKDPASLPLLQFCLEELYRSQSDYPDQPHVLTFEAYEKLGGVEGALAKRAQETFSALPTEVKNAFDSIMQRLVCLTREREGDIAAKKTVRRSDLAKDAATQTFIEAFVEARLIVADRDNEGEATISLAHEALLVRWKDLVDWIANHRNLLMLQDRIAKAADRWHEQPPEYRDGFLLPDGRQLAEGVELLEQHPSTLREIEVAFIRQSIARGEQLASAAREQARIATEHARRAEEQALQAREALAMSDYLQAVEKHLSGPQASRKIVIAHLVRALRTMPAHPLAGPFLASLLASCSMPRPLKTWRCLADNPAGTTITLAGFSPNRETAVCFGPGGALELRRGTGDLICAMKESGDQNRSPSFQFSQSGRLLAITRWDTVRLIHCDSGEDACPPLVHNGEITSFALSPEGHRLASGEQALQNSLSIWDCSTGQRRQEILHPDLIQAIAYAPDGSWLATGCEDGVVRIWNSETGGNFLPDLVHSKPVSRLLVSPNGTLLATVSGKKDLQLWNVTKSERCFPPLPLPDAVDLLIFSPDSHRLLVGCRNGLHRLYSTRSGRIVNEFASAVALVKSASPDGHRLAVASVEGDVTVWDASKGVLQAGPFTSGSTTIALGFSLEGKSLLTINGDGRGAEWDVGSGEILPVELWHRDKISSVQFSPDGKQVLSSSGDGVSIWDTRRGHSIITGMGGAPMKLAAYSADGSQGAAIGYQNSALLWQSLSPPSPPQELQHAGPINSLEFNHDGTMVATASDDRTARIWSGKTGHPLFSLEHQSSVVSAGFSADGTRLVTASWTFAFVWSAVNGAQIAGPFRHADKVVRATMHPSGGRLLTVSQPGLVQIWEVATGKSLVIRNHRARVTAAVFSPDGEAVLTTSEDGLAHLWDSTSGVDLIDPLRQESPATCATFNSTGQWLAIGHQDGTVHVRDRTTGMPVCIGHRHSSAVRQVEFSAQGEHLLVLTHACAHVWPLPPINRGIPGHLLFLAENLAGVKFDARTKLLRPIRPEENEADSGDISTVPPGDAAPWNSYLDWLDRGASTRTVHPYSPISREDYVRNLTKIFSQVLLSPHALADRELLAELMTELRLVEELTSGLGMSGLLGKLRQIQVRALLGLKDRNSIERALSLDPRNPLGWRLLADLVSDPKEASSLRDRASQIESRRNGGSADEDA
jgi:WD40 repeat protein